MPRPNSVAEIDFTPQHKPFPSPRDWRDQFIYQLLIDRFDDTKDYPPYDTNTAKRGRDRDSAGVFQGGKIKGITRRLDYIKGLGCTALWMSPPFKCRQDDPGSYHGYGIQDFLDVDPRIGTIEDLQNLVREAHQRDMRVVLDIVINHTADVFRYTENDTPFKIDKRYDFKEWHKISKGKDLGPDDAIWPVELQDPDAFHRHGSITNLTGAGPEEAILGDFFSLKDLDLHNPKVMDALIKVFKYWIAIADIDGYRIDTVRNVEPAACAVFVNAIHEYAKKIGKDNFIIFGEIVGNDDLLHKYIGGNTPVPGTDEWYPRLDAALDFPLYAVLEEVIKGMHAPEALWKRYEYFRKFFRNFGEAGQYYVTFLDNHDQGHRPFRRFMNNVKDDRVAVLGIGYVLCNLGIPCIYYGTEQGFDGGGDSDVFVRETMFGGKWGAFDTTGYQFFNDRNPIYRQIAKIAKARASEPALRYGRQYFRDISGDGEHYGCPTTGQATLAFSRVLDTDEILVVMNLDTKDRNDWVMVEWNLTRPGTKLIDLLGNVGELEVKEAKPGGASVRIPLKGRQLAILRAKK
ncbi:MAG TPA: alpha-amylase family glycosyl hydrolase [Tepidisphaeraceae bacterium]|jgi:glycosidase|nr:alpha-amylase family glycosyl hydrolase [Tepidisphaeraceae bacterium]